MRAAASSTAKVATTTETPATLRQLQAYVSKCLKDNKFPAFPKKISMGLSYYALPFPNAMYYPQQPYQNLLAEIKLRLIPQKALLAVPNYDTMSTMSSASTHSWKSVSVPRSVIQEDLFNKKCKGGRGDKATWSEKSDLSSVAGSTMSYNPADLNATGIQVVPRPGAKAKAPTPVAVKRLVVVCPAGVPIYNAPNWQEKLGDAKFLSAFTVKSRAGPWVETEKGWMLERHNPTGARFLVPAKAKDVLCVKLPAGHSLSVRKEPRMDCKEIVGRLVNGDVIVATGRHGNWVKHADGWSLRRNSKAVFIEEANSRPARANSRPASTPPVCFSWLENRGKCTKPDCKFSHEFPTKETFRSGEPKLCRAHHADNCKYARWPRACRFSHIGVTRQPQENRQPRRVQHCPTCDTEVQVNDWDHHVQGKKHKNRLQNAKSVAAKPVAATPVAAKPAVKPAKAQVPTQCLFPGARLVQALKQKKKKTKGVRISNLNLRPRKI